MCPTVLSEPAHFGLELLASHDAAGNYEFDTVAVWRDKAGNFFAGHDSGCSCPTPFENKGIPDLTPVRTLADVATFARSCWEDRIDWITDRDSPDTSERENHVAALLDSLNLSSANGGEAA